jgi:hypothetical protein
MTDNAEVFVQQVELVLDYGVDPAAPGAAVTVALCGHWDHEGACRWPHNNAIDTAAVPASLRVVFVADAGDAEEIRASIERALRAAAGWVVVASEAGAVNDDEAAVGERLLAAPRLD